MVCAATLGAAAAAERVTVNARNVEMTLGVDFSPRNLSAAKRTPIALKFTGTIRSIDAFNPNLSPLKELVIGLDRNSSIDGTDLPKCEGGLRLRRRSLPEMKAECRDAIVGGGRIGFGIVFPGEKSIPAESDLVVFNGDPAAGTTLYAFAQITAPIVTDVVMTIEIKKRARGNIGTEAIVTVPRIAGGSGFITDLEMSLFRTLDGLNRTHGIISLKCPNGSFLVKTRAAFVDGTRIPGELSGRCRRARRLAR